MTDGAFLIADDNPAKLAMLVSLVRKAKWPGEILTAMNTGDANALVDSHPEIRGAFIDYEIPSGNGPVIIRYLKAAIPACRIALVTAADSQRFADDATAAGAEAVVCTTSTREDPVAKIDGILREWMAA